jgi:glycosyltransferase involved in cell wall biosynthesis
MKEDNTRYISVIVTAYNRKNFLLNALKSVVNQTLDKKHYEIIVIKNYTDDIVDNFINKNNIKNIVIDGTIGEFLYAGVKGSNGEILAFLDDDDLFTEDKLEVVFNKFKANNNLGYYHNGHITVNDEYKQLDENVTNNIFFNISSISINRNILNIDNLKEIKSNTDDFMYLSALESDMTIYDEKEKLTYYMRHNSASYFTGNNINEFTKYRKLNLQLQIQQFKNFREMFVSKTVINYINGRLAHLEISSYIFDGAIKPDNICNTFKNKNQTFYSEIKIFIAYVLIRLHVNFRKKIIKVVFGNDKKV